MNNEIHPDTILYFDGPTMIFKDGEDYYTGLITTGLMDPNGNGIPDSVRCIKMRFYDGLNNEPRT